MRTMLRVLAMSSLCALSSLADPPKATPKEPPKQPETSLPRLAQQYLQTRMARHDRDMQALVMAIVLQKKQLVFDLATRIVTEPRLARPGVASDNEDTLNRQLPAQFFTLQDELRTRAQAVAEASKSSDKKLFEAFGRLAETCAACHAAFVKPEPEPEPASH